MKSDIMNMSFANVCKAPDFHISNSTSNWKYKIDQELSNWRFANPIKRRGKMSQKGKLKLLEETKCRRLKGGIDSWRTTFVHPNLRFSNAKYLDNPVNATKVNYVRGMYTFQKHQGNYPLNWSRS